MCEPKCEWTKTQGDRKQEKCERTKNVRVDQTQGDRKQEKCE